jgi:hypothetical protein
MNLVFIWRSENFILLSSVTTQLGRQQPSLYLALSLWLTGSLGKCLLVWFFRGLCCIFYSLIIFA